MKGGPLCAWDVSWKKKDSDVYYEDGHQSVLAERVVVGVVVDFDFRAICFASNGAWSEPWRPQVLEEDMPTFNEGLYPAISLRGRASFQFGPDFKHPPPPLGPICEQQAKRRVLTKSRRGRKKGGGKMSRRQCLK